MVEIIGISLVFSFLLTTGLTPMVISLSKKFELYDLPDEDRKTHRRRTPFMGGLAIITPFSLITGFSGFLLFPPPEYNPWFWLVVFGSYITGLTDDLFEIRALKRFLIQLAGAVIMIYGTNLVLPLDAVMTIFNGVPWINFIFTVIVFSAITNAFNLIDGMDGLCTSLALIASSAYSIINYLQGNHYYMVLSLVLSGSLAAFLLFNKPTAKIFLGDGGSYLIGVLLSILTVNFISFEAQPDFTPANRFFVGFALVAIPGLDMTRVFFLRIIRGLSPFTPDRNHIHHLFLSSGLTAGQTLLAILGLATFIVVMAFVLYRQIPFMLFAGSTTAVYVFLILMLKKYLAGKEAEGQEVVR
jgi:UDP-N-acetylmuramyl pentapeptide phosphotransferase/UDP-N-acetylglucosamine-1-phosphate transferase